MTSTVVVRHVATVVDSYSISLVPALNGDALAGLDNWSHCWIIYHNESLQMELYEIASVDIATRTLAFKTDISQNVKTTVIVDIKPFHPCDI